VIILEDREDNGVVMDVYRNEDTQGKSRKQKAEMPSKNPRSIRMQVFWTRNNHERCGIVSGPFEELKADLQKEKKLKDEEKTTCMLFREWI
jgi:hypothetical protein